jgi:phage baseplate assembly protein W
MSSNANLYNKITLPAAPNNTRDVAPKMYKGFSTVSTNSESFNLYDLELIKQDLLNHFHIRQGERLMQPSFGTVIWDLLFEPLTEQVKELILQDVNQIINYDPRIKAENVIITAYESGIQIECSLIYRSYNLSEALKLRFDQANGLLAQ